MYYRKSCMACMAIIMCWLCSCKVNTPPVPQGTAGTFFIIRGKGFSSHADCNKVSINGTAAHVVSATQRKLLVSYTGPGTGRMAVTVTVNNRTSDTVTLEIAAPAILARN